MKENVIISLADSNYFELLNELIDSVKDFQKEVICQKWQEFYDRIIDSTT